jgi:hypothetical protein
MTTLRNLLFMLLFGWVGFLPGSSMPQATMSGKAEMGGGYNYPGTWSDFVRREDNGTGRKYTPKTARIGRNAKTHFLRPAGR